VSSLTTFVASTVVLGFEGGVAVLSAARWCLVFVIDLWLIAVAIVGNSSSLVVLVDAIEDGEEEEGTEGT
jgi:hypothetical protein